MNTLTRTLNEVQGSYIAEHYKNASRFTLKLSCFSICLLIASVLTSTSVYSQEQNTEFDSPFSRSEISLSVAEGKSRWDFPNRGQLNSTAFRLAYVYTTDMQWQFGEDSTLRLELEAGAHHWKDPWLDEDKTGVFVNPMWRYYFTAFTQRLYFGAGIGLAYSNDDELIDRKLGSRFLFEDRLEAGIVLAKRHRVSVSVNHYSNANLADINHGVNFYFFNYAYRL
ncbi:acyloxyacyl hydrolase [Ningiella sp. W23]|uniref:acyloxyacyl hydrolase n=1 Tax=Ningiella sp. W23 TaxID=3023715 RepID=UPI003758395C